MMLSAAVASLAALTVLAGSIGWIMGDGAARRAQLTADLQSAVEESQRLQTEGKWPLQAQAAAGGVRPCCMPVPPIRVVSESKIC